MPEITPTTLHQRDDQFAEGPDFSSNEMSLSQNVWNQVFKLSIDQGVGYLLGRGQTANPLQAEGFLAMRFMDNTGTTAVQITGQWRFTVRTSGSGRLVTVLEKGDLEEVDSRDSSDNLKDRDSRKPVPVTEDAFETHEYDIWLELKPDADDTIDTSPDSGNTEMYVDGYQMEKVA